MAEAMHGTTIRRLMMRWRGDPAQGRTPAIALRLDRLLSQADWTPPGLKPGQILLIRRLVGLPSMRLGGTISADWEQALRQAVADCFRRAVRSGGGAALGNAESILFEDTAALVVQLTRELISAGAGASWLPMTVWYWPQVTGMRRAAPPSDLLTALWARHAQALPAALTSLSAGEIRRAAALLSPDQVRALAEALGAAYSLPVLPKIVARLADDEAAISIGHAESLHAPQSPEESAAPKAKPAHPARRAPRSVTDSAASAPAPWRPLPPLADLPRAAHCLIGWIIALSGSPGAARSAPFAAAVRIWADRTPERQSANAFAPRSAPTAPESLTPAPAVRAPDAREDLPMAVRVGSAPRVIQGQPTALAGAFCLINLLAALDMLAPFEGRVSGWAMLEGVARILLGRQAAQFADDPLWAILAMLADRSPEEALTFGLETPWTFEVHDRWAALDARWHGPVAPLAPETLTALAPDAAWWLARAASSLIRLLKAALQRPDSGAWLICRPGLVEISRVHVDIYIPLAHAALEIRRAGLDRDPGWVPDLGYIVLFHFFEP